MANELKMGQIEAILSLHQRGWSNRRIAKELGVHRETVARCIGCHQLPSKPARAPIGSEAACSESKPATPEGGAHAAKPVVMGGNDGQLPSAAGKQASLCEPWRQVILGKLEAGLTASAFTRIWSARTASRASITACGGLCGVWNASRSCRSGAWCVLPERRPRSILARAFLTRIIHPDVNV
jgi:hypothetical protein